jgi:KH domain
MRSCGIVLCSRDAKFAVDCDTCRLSYCLVCLASGSKDPCVRCGHRPSKRMEQLVHLRLKSIYKAFKQTSHSSSGRGGGGPSSSQHGGGTNSSAPTNTSTSTNLRERQNDDPDELHVAENPEVLLQHAAAASAAKLKQATSASSGHHASSNHHPRQAHPDASSTSARQPPTSSSSFLTMSSSERLELFMAEKAKADKAAADLLAELDEEEEQKKKSSKMSKKQKKKLKQQEQQPQQKSATEGGDSSSAGRGRDEAMDDLADNDGSSSGRHVDRRSPRSPRRADRDPNEEDGEQDDDPRISRDGKVAVQGGPESALDPIEVELETLIENEDVDGIEALLSSVKGVPGLAVLRKNAKKALKRFRVEQGDETEPAPINASTVEDVKPDTVSGGRNTGPSKLRKSSTGGNENPNRVEWSMRVDPSIVGYVIGKGGLRIRDLMEESGARIWVDQEGLGPNEQRMVCCSGYKKNVDAAIKLIIDVVDRAPTALVHSKVNPSGGKVAVDASKIPGDGPASSSDRISPSAAHRDPSKALHVLTCDPRFVPLLIGRRGWTIKNIQDSSGARVDIDQSVSPRRITISGSEGSVEVAVRMVRDVLSYPHSQLQGASESEKDDEEDDHPPSPVLTGFEAAPPTELDKELNVQEQCPEPARLSLSDAVARGANSPPSSLIMTGDAKSTVSASSSLSSTPEPSMASSLPKGGYAQVPRGPMLPPAYGVSHHAPAGSDLSPRDFPSNSYLLQQESPFGLPIAPPMTNHSAINLAAVQSVPTPEPQGTLHTGSLVPSVPQVQVPTPFAQAPGGIAGPPATSHVAPAHFAVGAYHTELHNGKVAPFAQASVMNEHPNLNLTGPLAGQTGHWNGAGAQSSLQLSSSSAAVADSFRFDAAVEFLQNTKSAPPSSQLVGGHPRRISASLPQRDTALLGLPVGPKQVAPGYLSSSNPAHVDSQIVDSLFGPTPGPVSDESMLLNGLQGLSLNKDYTQLGLWGEPAQPVDEKGLLGLGSYLTNDVRGSPTDLNVGDAPGLNIHHPPQSRFGW